MVLNVESEFLSLFVHGFKTAESWKNLIVTNLKLREQPWVAIFCKIQPNPLDKSICVWLVCDLVVMCVQAVGDRVLDGLCVCVRCGSIYSHKV